MSGRAYELKRSLIERHGGSMVYEHEGHRYDAWVITIGKRRKTIEAGGNQSIPELDQLYVPLVDSPKHWDDNASQLIPDAEVSLLSLCGSLLH